MRRRSAWRPFVNAINSIAKPAAGGAADLDALNAVIDDVCQ